MQYSQCVAQFVEVAYTYVFAHPRFKRWNRFLFRLGSHGLGLDNFFKAGRFFTGEAWFLRQVAQLLDKPIVFDVGANEGAWSKLVLERIPSASIYAFEPNPILAARLSSISERISVQNVGLGAFPAKHILYDYANHEGSCHASFVAGVIETLHGGESMQFAADVITIDQFMNEYAVDRIDLLKIDTEGYEYNILRGAQSALRDGRIKIIQLEFNMMNVLERVFMNDLFAMLGGQYRLYRLLPSGLLRIDSGQHWYNEQFCYQNLAAFHRSVALCPMEKDGLLTF